MTKKAEKKLRTAMRLCHIETEHGGFHRFMYLHLDRDGAVLGTENVQNVFNESAEAYAQAHEMQEALSQPVIRLGRIYPLH